MSKLPPVPEGFSRVTPHLIIDGAAEAIEFYKKAFNAVEMRRALTPDGTKIIHAELKIGDAVVMLCDDFPEYNKGKASHPKALGGSAVTLHQYVDDADAVINQALAAGAEVTMPPMDAFWGDRYGVIRDPFGHAWSIATRMREPSPQEFEEALKEMMRSPKE